MERATRVKVGWVFRCKRVLERDNHDCITHGCITGSSAGRAERQRTSCHGLQVKNVIFALLRVRGASLIKVGCLSWIVLELGDGCRRKKRNQRTRDSVVHSARTVAPGSQSYMIPKRRQAEYEMWRKSRQGVNGRRWCSAHNLVAVGSIAAQDCQAANSGEARLLISQMVPQTFLQYIFSLVPYRTTYIFCTTERRSRAPSVSPRDRIIVPTVLLFTNVSRTRLFRKS